MGDNQRIRRLNTAYLRGIKQAAEETSLEDLLSQIRFRHQSSDLNPTLRPLSYAQIAKARRSDYPLDKRRKAEDRYRALLSGADSDTSMLYASVGGKHNMSRAKDYPGYTHYFNLSPEQVSNAIFHVIHGRGETRPRRGEVGLRHALKHWDTVKDRGLDAHRTYSSGWTLKPRIEVVLPEAVRALSYVPQVEDREPGSEKESKRLLFRKMREELAEKTAAGEEMKDFMIGFSEEIIKLAAPGIRNPGLASQVGMSRKLDTSAQNMGVSRNQGTNVTDVSRQQQTQAVTSPANLPKQTVDPARQAQAQDVVKPATTAPSGSPYSRGGFNIPESPKPAVPSNNSPFAPGGFNLP